MNTIESDMVLARRHWFGHKPHGTVPGIEIIINFANSAFN